MYKSLEKVCKNFHLYVIAFDDETFKFLSDNDYPKLTVIPYATFEDEKLKIAKSNRTAREYFWTCGCHSIKHIMDYYEVNHCTYLDADLFFYGDPSILIERFFESGCNAGIIAHNYSDCMEYRYNEKNNGKYCVEFNTFLNNEKGREILNWWCDSCLESCPESAVDGKFGDQKYIEEFPKRFNGIYEYTEPSAGLAPWNISKYTLKNDNIFYLSEKKSIDVIFYHFHGLSIISEKKASMKVMTRPGKHDRKLLESLYVPYLKMINEEEKIIKKEVNFEDNNSSNNSNMSYLWGFLTNEPNIIMLIRKIYRYLLFSKKDIIDY